MTLAQRVRDQRYAKGWGPDELAGRAAISRTALYQIESGRTEHPRASTLRRIALALDVSTETLLSPHQLLENANAGDLESFAVPRTAPSPAVPARRRLDGVGVRSGGSDLDRKFREIMASPLGEGVARIVEETYRILPLTFAESRW